MSRLNRARLATIAGLLVGTAIGASRAGAQFPVFADAPSVEFRLTSAFGAPNVVAPGSTVPWELVVVVSQDNLGLAGFVCSVIECDAYPTRPPSPLQVLGLTLEPDPEVPAAMANFARPLGISNPANPMLPGSGYGGVQFFFLAGLPDAIGLLEIGGAQNHLGVGTPPDTAIGRSADLLLGVGQSPGGQVVARGRFTLPARSALDPDPVFDLPWNLELCVLLQESDQHAMQNELFILDAGNITQANVIEAVGPPGTPALIRPARVRYGPRLRFVVVCRADFNQSGSVTVQDVFDFLDSWFAWTNGDPVEPSPDINQDGQVSMQDLFDFLALYFAGCGE